jgi:dolichyl-phosphate-mannose-protein mannosyltransferase
MSIYCKFKNTLHETITWPHLGLVVLVLFTLAVHFSSIMQPASYLFDESYYVTDARSILAHQGTLLTEHPPLAKLFIIEGIRIFGDNPFGWRFFSVIFGTISIVLLYFICRRLGMSQLATLIATFLFSLENLSFIQASVAMLDVYCLTFMLACILFYLRGSFLLSGLFAGLSALAKLTGISVLGVILLFWLITDRKNWRLLSYTIFICIAAFLILMPLIEFTIMPEVFNPLRRLKDMLSYASGLTSTNLVSFVTSTPWDWLMNRGVVFYNNSPQYIAAISFTITPFIIPVILFLLYRTFGKQRSALIALLWFICNYVPWVIVSLVIHRFTYIYYMYPVIVGLCFGLGLALSEIIEISKKKRHRSIHFLGRAGVTLYLVAHLAVFVILSPLTPSVVTWIA